MKINVPFRRKDTEIETSPCVIEKTIELSVEQFDHFSENLLNDYDFILENTDCMYQDQNGINHCLLVLGEGRDDGILVESEGNAYARYSAFVPNARQLLILDKYPSLNHFIERMSEVADDILLKAVAESSEGNLNYIAELDKYNKSGEPIVYSALLNDMLTDSGMVEDTILQDDYIELCLSEQVSENQYRQRYDETWSAELEVIYARHALWIYGESDGEQADFSNCILENVDFSNRNLCGAIFSGAVFINCNLDDASMCDADFEGAKFRRCSLKHFTAEGGNFKSADFYNSDLNGAYFTESNFAKSKIYDCNFHKASFMNCCLEAWECRNCDIHIANMSNVNYDESDWLSEQNDGIVMESM